MESVVVLQKSLYEQTGEAAVSMGISRERLVSLALEEYLAAHRRVSGSEQVAGELRALKNASMSDIWDMIKDDTW